MNRFCAVAAALLVIGVSPLASAVLAEQDQAAVQKWNAAKEAYQAAVQAYKQAREDWIAARDALRQFRDAPHTQAALEKARTFLLKGIDRLVKYLEWIRARAEVVGGITEGERTAVLAEIDSDITGLNNLKPAVEAAADRTQLAESAKKIRDQWLEVRPGAKRIVGQILAAKINYVLEKAENVSARISEKISALKTAGKDTSALEDWLAKFNNNINLAREKYEAAKQKFQAISSVQDADALFREGHQFIKDAAQYLREAHAALKEIVKELRKDKYRVISGTGRLYAQGDGRAVITGSGTVTVSASTGTLVVSPNAQVTTNGTGTKEVLGNGDVKYEGYGTATITGTDMRVEISGNGINLVAEGTGTARLSGKGTYYTEKDAAPKTITETETTVSIEAASTG